jgi:hypothetical protein
MGRVITHLGTIPDKGMNTSAQWKELALSSGEKVYE